MDYADRPDGMIEIVCKIRSGHIFLDIIDDGLPFDPTGHKAAVIPHTLNEANPGGHGIQLIRHYTDTMQYRRENNRNFLHMSLLAS
jgi:anti-sigma regulatory factor (Ser/Thr protein kinase)